MTVARHFQQRGEPLELGMREKDAELLAHQPVADVVVAISVRAEGRLRVVHVQAAQPLEPELLVELGDRGLECGLVGHVDARGPPVAGVDADTEPGPALATKTPDTRARPAAAASPDFHPPCFRG